MGTLKQVNTSDSPLRGPLLTHRLALIGSGIDNLMVDGKGAIWAAGVPKLLTTRAQILDPVQTPGPPSSVFKIALNVRESFSYGERYTVPKVLEYHGTKVSGITSALHDATRGRFFTHGVVGESLVICETK